VYTRVEPGVNRLLLELLEFDAHAYVSAT